MVRQEITNNDKLEDVIKKMTEGVPGASVILANATNQNALGWFLVLELDSMNMRGSQIWLGYKDYCGEDVDLFWDCVKKHDAQMVEAVNIETAKCGQKDKAVQIGGSSHKENLLFTQKEMKELAKKPKIVHPKAMEKISPAL